MGRYPFDVYGVLAADELFGYALETQTLSLHPGFLVDETQVDPIDAEPILVHELAHQWFGDDATSTARTSGPSRCPPTAIS